LLQIMLIGMLCFLPALLIIIFVIPILSGVGGLNPLIFSIIWFACVAVIAVVVTQISPILPAAAIGRPLQISEAWEKTKGSGWSILVVVVLYFVFQLALTYLVGISAQVFMPLGIAFNILVFLLLPMVTISLLTTFYGHYVEGREIG